MRIGIDIDGIINNIEKFQLENAIPFFKEKYNKEVVNPNGFDVRDIFGLSEDEEYMRREFWKPFIFELARKAPVRNGIKELIARMKENGDVPYIVTERYATDRKNAWGALHRKFVKDYLKANDIDIDEDKIIFCTEGHKLDAYKEHELDMALEDNVKNIDEFVNNGISVVAIKAGYNKDYERDGVYKVEIPYEIADKIEEIRSKKKELNQKSKIKRPGEFPPTTGYASKDTPWLQYYTEEEANFEAPKMKIYDYLYEQNKDHMDSIVLDDNFGNTYTFKEFFDEVEKYAKAFKSYGINEGDHVIVGLPNLPETQFAKYALNRIGAIPVMINPLSSKDEMGNYLKEKSLKGEKPKMMLMFNRSYEALKDYFDDPEIDIKKYINIGVDTLMKQPLKTGYKLTEGKNDPDPKVFDGIDKVISLNDFIKHGENYTGIIDSEYKENQGAIVYYTGGTTGAEKPAIISNESCNAIAKSFSLLITNSGVGDVTLNAMPWFHVFGDNQIFHFAACQGMNNVAIVKISRKDIPSYFKKHYPVKNCNGVPTFFRAIFSTLKEKDYKYIDQLANTINGGAALNADEKTQINKILSRAGSKASMTDGYGITEGSGGVIWTLVGADEPNCIGVPIPGVIAKIVDPETGLEVPYDTEGELCFSGAPVMLGYLNNPEENARALRTDEDGRVWLHTGDLARCNSEGKFYYVERKKRMIIVSGENVYPSRIENVIKDNVDEVEDCFIFGQKDSYRGEVPIAKVKLKEGVIPTLDIQDKIMEVCREKFGNKKNHPVRIDFIKYVPMTKKSSPDFRSLQDENLVISVEKQHTVSKLTILKENYAGNRLYRNSKALVSIWYKYINPVTAIGLENIPEKGAGVIGLNHLHVNDQFPLMVNVDRIISFLAKQEYFDKALIGKYYTKLGMIPVDRFGDANYARKWIEEVINSTPLDDFEKEEPMVKDLISYVESLPERTYSKPGKILEATQSHISDLFKGSDLQTEIDSRLDRIPLSGKENGYGHAHKAFLEAEERLSDGRLVGIFPEGTRNKDFYQTGEFLPMSSSAAVWAREFGAPLIPAAVNGDHKVGGKLLLRVGEPMYIDKDLNDSEVKEAMTDFENILYNLVVANLIEQPNDQNIDLLQTIIDKEFNVLSEENKNMLAKLNGKLKGHKTKTLRI